jgi:hypothetical protein
VGDIPEVAGAEPVVVAAVVVEHLDEELKEPAVFGDIRIRQDVARVARPRLVLLDAFAKQLGHPLRARCIDLCEEPDVLLGEITVEAALDRPVGVGAVEPHWRRQDAKGAVEQRPAWISQERRDDLPLGIVRLDLA